jgi:2-amino-4-hydroxy-6-hydroxymethyldihydropteridine diphosphokinase
MVEAYLGVGTNLGQRPKNIKKAISALNKIEGLRVIKVSSLYETEHVGGPPQRKFLNGAVKIKTNILPHRLLRELKGIEKKIGRKKTVKNGPRIIDLDILLYGSKVVKTKDLIIPHPRMGEREFVMKPLKEIS